MKNTGSARSNYIVNRRVGFTLLVIVGLAVGLMINLRAQRNPSMHLVWNDEFSGYASSPVDPAKWNHDTGGNGWGNNEWEYYTDATANASLDGHGHLTIQAKRPDKTHGTCAIGPCDITSARLLTDGTYSAKYGRIEARMKLPAGQGIWPAFWMLSTKNQGEIDIMENRGDEPQNISGTLHGPNYSGAQAFTKNYNFPPGHSSDDGFHVYALNWTAEKIDWSVDNQIFQTVTKSQVSPNQWVFDHPYYLLLNLAVGGDYAGYPDSTTTFPAKLEVDYLRVYQYK